VNIQELSQHEILQEKNINWLYKACSGEKNEIYFEYRNHAKKLNVTREFDSKFSQKNKTEVNKKMNYENFCRFNDEKFDLICTGSWKATTQGIFKQVPNYDTGNVDLVEASRMMIVPNEIYKNIDTGIEKIKLNYFRFNKWHELICDKSTISVNHKAVELSNQGIDITSSNAKNIVDYFYDCLTLNDESIIPYYKSTSKMGWVNENFLPYDSDIKFDGEKDHKYMFDALQSPKGELKDWIDYVKPLKKNILFRMALASSFASPLIEKVGALPFIFHLWGGTGSYKTVSLIVAMSIWGNPDKGRLVKTLNMTQNSMLAIAGFLNNIPFAGNELQNIKTNFGNYDKMIMRITEGIDRARMSYDKVNETKSWNCSFLLNGEEPIVSSNSGGGAFNRVIQAECQYPVIDLPGQEVVDFVKNNFGNVGREFIKIIKKIDLKKEYEEILKEFEDKTDSSNKQIMSMALIVLADRISSTYLFKDEPMKVKDTFKFLFDSKSIDVTERAYEYVISLISANINKFTDKDREVWGKLKNNGQVYFNKDVLNKKLKEDSFDFEACKKKWLDNKYIELNSQNRFIHGSKINGVSTNFILFNLPEEDDGIIENPFY
jgi:uncharacterized protein (DUF927 family)